MPYVSDFGGNAQDRGDGYVTKLEKTKVVSFRCNDCAKLFYLTHAQNARRKAGARCPKCGGLGEETDSSVHRRLGTHKKDVGKLVGKVAAKVGRSIVSMDTSDKPFMCNECYKAFRSSVGLKLHYEEAHDRVFDFEEEE